MPASSSTSLLRLATAGSVDDGKSTLVGRLLYDCRTVLADQWAAVERASRDRGLPAADLALLTDGLRAEREQGITIDVAYRYFATGRRRFILADTPGHLQYTRNMATGASTAQVAVVLVDARHGVVEQTRRHVAIAALLRVPHLVLAVNKMDLAGFDQGVFDSCVAALGEPAASAIPVSALHGDNVVDRSAHTDWYRGPTLLEFLEGVPTAAEPESPAARFPVQYVIRTGNGRSYAGRLETGTLAVGDEVVVLPSGRRSVVSGLDVLGTEARSATAGQSLAVRLADEIDLGRGDLIAAAAAPPALVQDLTATVCHVADRPLRAGDRIWVKHGTRTVRAIVTGLLDRLDIDTGAREPGPAQLAANDIGTVGIRTAAPLPLDSYAASRSTGALLLIDEADGGTLAAGMALDVPDSAG